MIPLSDVDRRPVNFPVVTAFIIAANTAVFIVELLKGDPFVARWVFVPAEISSGQRLVTVVTAMFLHGGWFHILGNMVYLWAFGPEIEDVMGPLRYFLFYLSGGVAASFAQVIADPSSPVPNLGASGAIAAVMGSFLVTFPRDRIRTVVFLGWFVTITLIPSVVLVGFWFIIQLFSEVGSLFARQGGGIAYMAHLGGLGFGVIAARIFTSPARRPRRNHRT